MRQPFSESPEYNENAPRIEHSRQADVIINSIVEYLSEEKELCEKNMILPSEPGTAVWAKRQAEKLLIAGGVIEFHFKNKT